MTDIDKKLNSLAPHLLQIGILLAVAMTTVHVSKFLLDHDGWLGLIGGAAMPMATVGASAIAFDGRRQNRGRAWAAVVFFALCSSAMQIAYFMGEAPATNWWLITTAIARGIVWPIGEVLLGGVLAFLQESGGKENSLLSNLQEATDQLTKELTSAKQTIDQLTTNHQKLEAENQRLRQVAEAQKPAAKVVAINPPEVTANLTTKQQENIRQILSVLQSGGFATDAELAEAAGWSETSARRYRQMAEGAGIIYKNGDGRYHQSQSGK